DSAGRVIQSSDIIRAHALVQPAALVRIGRPTVLDTTVPAIDNTTRLLVDPVALPTGTVYVIEGSSLQDRRDQMLQLAATLAIGGPVALALMSWAGWLLAGAALRPVERMRRDAAEGTEHLIALAEDLLVMSRAHGGNLPVNPRTVDLSDFLNEVVSRFGSRAEASGVALSAEAPEGEVNIDPVRMRQALDDLVDNALRHTPRGGSVTLSGGRDDGAIRFEVRDS